MPDNGICERFHRTVLDEFYRIAFRKKIYHTIDELQADLDTWLVDYNYRRPNTSIHKWTASFNCSLRWRAESGAPLSKYTTS